MPEVNYVGLFGYTERTIIENVTLENIDITGGSFTGGLVDRATSSSASNSYWDTDTTGQTKSAGGVGKSTSQMKDRDTYEGWDFESVWQIDENVSYPTLKNIAN